MNLRIRLELSPMSSGSSVFAAISISTGRNLQEAAHFSAQRMPELKDINSVSNYCVPGTSRTRGVLQVTGNAVARVWHVFKAECIKLRSLPLWLVAL